jgi:hypothetical protein
MKNGVDAAGIGTHRNKVRSKQWRPVIMLAFLWSLTLSTRFGLMQAATIQAKSPSLGDVRTAVQSARDGDTVTVPAATETWTTSLEITKNITLQGAGPGLTVIIDAVPEAPRSEGGSKQPSQGAVSGLHHSSPANGRSWAPGIGARRPNPLIFINLARDLPFRLTGFTFKGASNDVENAAPWRARIRLTGKSHAFRVDHCTFDSLHAVNVSINGFLWGVIDHCQFNLARVQPMQIYHTSWNGADQGNGSWADDSYWGSGKFVFIEDNVFDNPQGFKRSIDGYEGARFVVRHNQFHNADVSAHGTEGQGRGARAIEEYNNVYRNDQRIAAAQIRSGCIITHDNRWTNVTRGHVLQVYRQFQNSPHWGWSNGQNPYDDNALNSDQGYWETGKHTGPNGATVLSDSTKNWTPNQWYQPGATYIIRNITAEARARNNREKIQSFAISNTSNAITCSAMTVSGKLLSFNTGDTYQIWKVVHSLDQPGLGKGDLLTGLPGRPAQWPNQVSEPCYSWNNTQDGKPVNLSSTEPSIKEGRDFFNETPKPGYTPFTYPHPLVSGALVPTTKTAEKQRESKEATSSLNN